MAAQNNKITFTLLDMIAGNTSSVIKREKPATSKEACKIIYDDLAGYEFDVLVKACLNAGFEGYLNPLVRNNLATYILDAYIAQGICEVKFNGYASLEELMVPIKTETSVEELMVPIKTETSVEELMVPIKTETAEKPNDAEAVEKPTDQTKTSWSTVSRPEMHDLRTEQTSKQTKKTAQSWFDTHDDVDDLDDFVTPSDTPRQKHKFDKLKTTLSAAARLRFNGKTLAELELFIAEEAQKAENAKKAELIEEEAQKAENAKKAELIEEEAQKAKAIEETKSIEKQSKITKAPPPSKKGSTYISIPPKLRKSAPVTPVKPVKNQVDEDGFITVVKPVQKTKESLFTKEEVAAKLTTVNKNPNNEKTVTSAGWFLLPVSLFDKETDWFAHRCDENGDPIGWYRVNDFQWKIHEKSQFVHTKHSDGTWTTKEIIPPKEDRYGNPIKGGIIDVSIPYLTWILTPAALRRGPCPKN